MLRALLIHFCRRLAALGLLTWAMAASVLAVPAERVYTVRRGDTLYGIAQHHGLSAARLAERNGLGRNYYVYANQKLIIPPKSSARTVPPEEASGPAPALPCSVQRFLDEAEVKPGRWKYIVIHHSGVDTGTLSGIDRYHREERHMENGLGYHFLIGNGNGMADGEIGVGSRWTKQLEGGHLRSESQNRISLGICLVGNFDKNKPTPKQLERLTALIRALLTRCRLSPSAVKTHQQINVSYTRCPGRYFPMQRLMASLEESGRTWSRVKR